jgi:hypothetical protein
VEQLAFSDFPFALGTFRNLVSAARTSENGHEVARFDAEVAHWRSQQTLPTMAASRPLGSPLPAEIVGNLEAGTANQAAAL